MADVGATCERVQRIISLLKQAGMVQDNFANKDAMKSVFKALGKIEGQEFADAEFEALCEGVGVCADGNLPVDVFLARVYASSEEEYQQCIKQLQETNGGYPTCSPCTELPTANNFPAGAGFGLGLELNQFKVSDTPHLADSLAWLGWAPPPTSACYGTLNRAFPGNMPGSMITRRCTKILSEHNVMPGNTIHGQSICPDEINNQPGHFAREMESYFGNVFPMGGISGAPFVGKTGFAAFSGHVPDDGHVFILFGPHIAVSASGELGKHHRQGQSCESSACGAVLAAYGACKNCNSQGGDFDAHDMEQNWLQCQIADRMPNIESAAEPLAALIHETFDIIKEKLLNIVNFNFGGGNLVLLGGIQINMPDPCDSHFQPLFFQVSRRDAPEPMDLLPQLRCDAAVSPHNFFSWMRWAPDESSPCMQALNKHFPTALPGQVVLHRHKVALAPFQLTPLNTIYGQSICPDEINNEKNDLATVMGDYYGKVFPMGGISGAPFVGKTGFTAFSHHVPDNGNVLILFGPHIAISADGELGKYHRRGQCKHTGACGAVLAAYNACKQDAKDGRYYPRRSVAEAYDATDMQQAWLKNRLSSKFQTIECAEEPLVALIHAAYELVEEKLLAIVNTNFSDGKLILIGGVQINMPEPYDDHFEPLFFQVMSKDAQPMDMLPELLLPNGVVAQTGKDIEPAGKVIEPALNEPTEATPIMGM